MTMKILMRLIKLIIIALGGLIMIIGLCVVAIIVAPIIWVITGKNYELMIDDWIEFCDGFIKLEDENKD